MIDQTEIRQRAGALAVPPQVVDHDYVLGCFLHFLGTLSDVRESWVFKGGTALAKCYFPLYRFSEDLDFTLQSAVTGDALRSIIDRAKVLLQGGTGIVTDQQETSVEVVRDDYGEESFEMKCYYSGPWVYGGSPRSIKIHVNRDEVLAFRPQHLAIRHEYSDRDALPQTRLSVYALEEVFVEKLRAFSGQRKYAVARDIFDLHYLSSQKIDFAKVGEAFDKKCRVKGIDPHSLHSARTKSRIDEYRQSWKNHIELLLPKELQITFEDAWNTAFTHLEQVIAP